MFIQNVLLETYKKAQQPKPSFNGTVCDTKMEVEDFINHMSVQYGKVRK